MLRLENITKYFLRGTLNEIAALDNLNLHVHDGDFISVIGSNGAGKSTLLKVIAGLVHSDAGHVLLQGEDVTNEPEYQRAKYIGRIAQDPTESTCAVMTIEENLAMAAKRGQPRGLRRAVTDEKREAFRQALSTIGLGLEERLSARVGTLSGGQRQALALLMATLAEPKVLLLDEHLANLDPKTAELVMQLTDRLVRQNALTTVMVTHNMRQAITWGNRLIMMHEGRIIVDVAGEEKQNLRVDDLVMKFYEASQEEFTMDRALLAV